MKTTRQFLIEAKALIPDKEHWWRGEGPGSVIGSYCPVTALTRATAGDCYIVDKLFRKAAGIAPSRSIGQWNDDPARTLAEVHAAFDAAIAACPEEEC